MTDLSCSLEASVESANPTSADTPLETLAALLSYPDTDKLRALAALQYTLPEAQQNLLVPFRDFAASHPLTRLEELFTRTFDMNPSACLEVGWHLYGEDYERGRFLVAMRESLRESGIQESNELPDHLSHCLRLLPHLPEDVAAGFSQRCLLPAVEKILENLDGGNPYRGLVELVRHELHARFGPAISENKANPLQIVMQSKRQVCSCSH